MVANEEQARQHRTFFRYTSVSSAPRTGGHLWTEKVAETPDGLLRRLIAEDSKPLSPDRAAAEDRRIAALVADPSALRAANADRRADEARCAAARHRAGPFSSPRTACRETACALPFVPTPRSPPPHTTNASSTAWQASSSFACPQNGCVASKGHLVDRVSFGYGLLGHIDQGSHFGVTRVPITAMDWKTSKIAVHVDGRILLLKSISRDERRHPFQRRTASTERFPGTGRRPEPARTPKPRNLALPCSC